MTALISLTGIDKAIAALFLKEGTLKANFLVLLRSYFPTEHDLQTVRKIPAEDLVARLWNTDDLEEIRQKRKNLSSLKSAINKSLRNLDKKGKNPEGIIIGKDNVFTVSDKRKDDLIKNWGLSGESPTSVREMLSAFKSIFSEMIAAQGVGEVGELLKELDKTKELVRQLSGAGNGSDRRSQTDDLQKSAAHSPSPEDSPGGTEAGMERAGETDNTTEPAFVEAEEITESEFIETEDIEEDELVEIEEIDEADLTEEPGVAEAGGEDRDGQMEEVDESELVEVEDIEDEEVLDHDPVDIGEQHFDGSQAVEEIEEDELVKVEEIDEAELAEAGGEDSDGQLEEVDESELVEIEEIDEADLTEEPGVAEAGGEDRDGQMEEVDESELVEVEDTEGEEVLDHDLDDFDEQHFDGSQAVEEIEEDELVKVEEIDEAELAEAGGEDSDGQLEEVDESELVEVEDIEADELLDHDPDDIDEQHFDGSQAVEEIEEDELVKVEEIDEADLAEEPGVVGAGGEDRDGQLEEVDESELVEVEDIEADKLLDHDPVDIDEQPFDSSQAVEEIEEDELVEVEEIEEIDAGEGIGSERDEPGGLIGPIGSDSPLASRGLLEALSRYIDPADALAGETELLRETQDEYTAQILERFMPKFIKIPAGRYLVGSRDPKPPEKAAQSVTIPSFYMGQFPVTNDLFELFVRETGYETDAEKTGFGMVHQGRCVSRTDPATGRSVITLHRGSTARQVAGANWRHPSGPGSSLEGKHNHPVVQVSRKDAVAFASWAGKRLPTEEEWEAAARGKDGSLFPWGDTWLAENGNFASSYSGDTSPVNRYGGKAMSPFGLYDMLGNVYEWTATPYEKAPAKDGQSFILKGGSWASGGTVTVCQRLIEKGSHWSNTIGFRCAV